MPGLAVYLVIIRIFCCEADLSGSALFKHERLLLQLHLDLNRPVRKLINQLFDLIQYCLIFVHSKFLRKIAVVA